MVETISIVHLRCRFGGSRAYFICPVEVPQARQGETLVQPPDPADTTKAVYKKLTGAQQQSTDEAARAASCKKWPLKPE